MRRRMMAGCVLLCVLLGVTGGCKKETETKETPTGTVERTEYMDDAVVTIDGAEVGYREAMLYLQAAKQEYESAYGGEICQVCTEVEVMDNSGNCYVLTGEEMDFSYRHSRLENTGDIVLSATFALTKKSTEEIRSVMQDLMARRRNSQPLDMPSAGSAFKRPVGGYAAALIDQSGLKGYRVGGAAVSEKHAGFVVNLGDATAEDVKQLLQDVSQKVFAITGIPLEPEIRIW